MNAVNYGKSAFPIIRSDGMGNLQPEDYGMTLRDYFAATAMNGLISKGHISGDAISKSGDVISKIAYSLADAMIVTRGAE